MSEGWVTDPAAIDVICALGGLEPGDEVQLTHNVHDYGALPTRAGKVATILEKGNYQPIGSSWPLGGEPAIAVATTKPEGGWFAMCRKIITAWRRPAKNSQ